MKDGVYRWRDPLPNLARQRCPEGVRVATTQELVRLDPCHGIIVHPSLHVVICTLQCVASTVFYGGQPGGGMGSPTPSWPSGLEGRHATGRLLPFALWHFQ